MAENLVKEAREAIELSHEFDRDNRAEALEDLRFVAGHQWSDADIEERKGRPRITINRSQQFLKMASNPIRQNMPTLKVEPDSDEDSDLAEVANGLFRRIQYNSSASHVYAAAVEHMTACGIGWWRVTTDYEDEESFNQEIKIKRIFNPLSVYPDPSSLEPDRSTMNWCLVTELYPVEAFKAKYPKAVVREIDAPANGWHTKAISWAQGDYVRVAEYWRRKEVMRKIARLATGETVSIDDMPNEQLEFLKFNGMIAAVRDTKSYKVVMDLVSGAEQLEESYECPCRWIPIVPVIGSEIPLENGTYRHGIIRFQREPARLMNYFLSVTAEMLGQSPKAPYMATAKQIGKFKSMWDNANRKPMPYLLYEEDPANPGAPKRADQVSLPAGFVQFAQLMEDAQKATTGLYDAALGAKSNETSGVAIGARVEQGNQATFHLTDNLQHGLEHTGRIILDMIPKVYDTARTLRMMAEDGTETEAQINTPTVSYDGTPAMVNDVSRMKFKSVRVIMGPNYQSRKQEALNQLSQLIQAMPQIGQVGADIVVRNMEFEGAEQLGERLKAILPPQVLQMENPEMAMAQQPPPDPMADVQMQAQSAMMESEVTSAQAKAAQEVAKAEGAQVDVALKVKKLREPTPRPGQPGSDGNRPAF